MMKKKYIAPETEIVHVPIVNGFLAGSVKGENAGKSGDEDIPWGEGGLDDGEEVSAKPHSVWDDDMSEW